MGFTPALYGNTLQIYATLNWEFMYGEQEQEQENQTVKTKKPPMGGLI